MPNLSCRTCGRVLYTVSPLTSLFAEERRCPRCGAQFFDERREGERRNVIRRVNRPDDPGPPAGPVPPKGGGRKKKAADDPAAGERRVADRRTVRRRTPR